MFNLWLIHQAKVHTSIHVCKLDKKPILAGKLLWVEVHSLRLLCCAAGCYQAECDNLLWQTLPLYMEADVYYAVVDKRGHLI